jgi:hypothetical protein
LRFDAATAHNKRTKKYFQYTGGVGMMAKDVRELKEGEQRKIRKKSTRLFFLIARSGSFFSSPLKPSSGPADKKPVVMKKARL